MKIDIHPHAKARMYERGATRKEVELVVRSGERFKAKFGRIGCRMNFPARGNTNYRTKQLEVYGVEESNTFVVITIITKYF